MVWCMVEVCEGAPVAMVWYGMVWYDIVVVCEGAPVAMIRYDMVWYGMLEVCEGAPVSMAGWALADAHPTLHVLASMGYAGVGA